MYPTLGKNRKNGLCRNIVLVQPKFLKQQIKQVIAVLKRILNDDECEHHLFK